ncbi:accessory Sec system protein Asp1 [Lactococcus petauri]|uniref:accessory Sec system protein Asp1 n=1 Tax=Lactococcus petauri TaxID=1940789 RepID=UPI00385520E7
MIYFVPAWEKGQLQGFNTDEMIGPIRSFMVTGEDYKVIVKDYIPELRYFLHRFDLLESNFYSVYDVLQGTEARDQKQITFVDLNFPEDAYFIYTPFNLLVYQGEDNIGTITLGEASQVLEVTYYLEENKQRIEVYDDRGFLSQRKHFEQGIHVETEILDGEGVWVVRVHYPQGQCMVNEKNSKELLKKVYESEEELQFEILEKLLHPMETHDRLMVSVTNQNIIPIKNSPYLERMTLSFFQSRFNFESEEAKVILCELAPQTNGFLLDSEASLKKVHEILPKEEKEKIHHLTPYDTRFELSLSQELKEEVLYLEARKMNEADLNLIVSMLLEYIKNILFKEENQRLFKVVIRVASHEEKRRLEQKIEECLFNAFPKEMELLEKLPPSTQGENTVELEKLQAQFPLILSVMSLKTTWDIQVIQNEADIFKNIHHTRLVIDLSHAPDLFTQVAGISAGIPQINRIKSEYVKHHKNGWIIEVLDDLPQALDYYLETLRHWQEARAYSAQEIKHFSGPQLQEKLRKIVGG